MPEPAAAVLGMPPGQAATNAGSFHLVTIGWTEALVSGLCDRVEERTEIRFSHIVTSNRDLREFDGGRGRRGVYFLRDHPSFRAPVIDRVLLGSLEQPDMLSIHNMILSDRVTRYLPYEESLAFATSLAHAFTAAYRKLAPSVVVASFDNLHAGISLAVARRMGIPWVALSFTALPVGLTGFCSGLTPNTVFAVQEQPDGDIRALAERTLTAFEAGSTVVPVYLSANNLSMVVRRAPAHVRALFRQLKRNLSGEFDKYTEYHPSSLCRMYLRKRFNILTMPKRAFCETPPETPYVFFGFHMQPESSIDVWAPFYSDQFSVAEAIARSVPPTHQILMKPHKSDADTYSRDRLKRLQALPGVRLVSPFADSRPFLERASLVVTIMGTMALESAMLGRPVLMFGESKFTLIPGVSSVGAITDLPAQIRAKLSETRPSREDILRGLASYLRPYSAGCYNDWDTRPSDDEVGNFVEQLQALRSFLKAREARAGS